MDSNFSDRVKSVISHSREEAIRLGHDYIGPEHLLLGLISEGEGIAVRLLDEMGIDLEKPIFSKAVKKLNGTEITIKGYILPLKASKDQKYFILSAYPYNMCFFCGGAGPESVMEVFSTKPVKSSKKMVKLKGTLRVNYNPTLGQVLYTLKDAEVID